MKGRTVLVYSLAHFAVDFACAFLVYSLIARGGWALHYALVYNFCAFALQLPVGILADRLDRNALVAAAGCLLVGAAYGALALPLVAVVVAGVGNSLFHVGGGVDVLNLSEKDGRLLGIFVSPGAFGLYLGALAGGRVAIGWAVAGMALFCALIPMARYLPGQGAGTRPGPGGYLPNAPFSLGRPGGAAVLAAICLFLVVCLRSYVGLTLAFPWKGAGLWGLALVCAVVLGKAAGGFLAARLGAKMASALSLGLAAALFLLSALPLPGVLAVLLFNMTMPITLWAMARLFPGAKGFSFGLLTFGLFLGYLPVYLGHTRLLPAGWGLPLAAAVSLGLLVLGLRRARP